VNLDGSRLSSSVPQAITVPSNVLLARQDGYWNSDRARQLVLMFACRDAYVALP